MIFTSTNDATVLLKLYNARVYASSPLELFIARSNLRSNPSIRVGMRLLIKYYPPNVKNWTINTVNAIESIPMF